MPSSSEIPKRLAALDRLLVKAGFPATSPWWIETIRRFYESGKRQLVLRVGRRGGKSSTLCRLAVCEALYGAHVIPPGDVGTVAFISVSRDEATQRLRTIKQILDALGVKYKPIDSGVELQDRPVVFKVFSASIGGVSGFTSIAVICDETAKWLNADGSANPAHEVLSSVRPTMATQPRARIFLSSSPLGRLDAHAQAFDAGADALQDVAFAESWVANPSLTREQTRELERDEGRWLREYAAIPLEETDAGILSAALLDRATRDGPDELPDEDGVTYVAAIDPATRANGWTLCVAAKRYAPDASIKRSVVLTREWRGSSSAPLDPDQVFAEIAGLLEPYGVTHLITDQWAGDALASIARRHGLWLLVETRTASRNVELYEALATLLADGAIELNSDRQVRADLLNVRRRVTANGIGIALVATADGRHADYAPAVASALVWGLDKYGSDPTTPGPSVGTVEWHRQEEDARREQRRVAVARDIERRSDSRYWRVAPSDRIRPTTARGRRIY